MNTVIDPPGSAIDTNADMPREKHIPSLIHVLNVAALVLLGLIVFMATVALPRHLIFLSPILILLFVYKLFYKRRPIILCYFALTVFTLFWILFCENIVAVDNLIGTRVTAGLPLGPRLRAYVDANLTSSRRHFYQQCCGDPLSYNLKPGSRHTETYDCPTCNDPYQTVADETGYLNKQVGLMTNSPRIDIFIAGDSVLQGVGMPSVVESLRDQIPVTMWNLSLNGYGPRQKINTLLTYALPKHPQWLVVEFFSENDVSDAIEDDVCGQQADFRCRFSFPEVRRRLLAHPVYRTMLGANPNEISLFDSYAENYFTLAVSKHLIHTLRYTIKVMVREGNKTGDVPLMPGPPVRPTDELRDGQFLSWVRAGMAVTHREYERLVTRLAGLENKPKVILLYNPSAYEIYRDIFRKPEPEYNEIAVFQLEAQRAFAKRNGWIFVDLTEPLRNTLKRDKAWIYGRYDQMHWSQKGTAVIAPILGAELLKVISK